LWTSTGKAIEEMLRVRDYDVDLELIYSYNMNPPPLQRNIIGCSDGEVALTTEGAITVKAMTSDPPQFRIVGCAAIAKACCAPFEGRGLTFLVHDDPPGQL
jgi:hypothetical protein